MLNKKGVITMLKIKCTVEFRDKEASTYRSVGDEFVVEDRRAKEIIDKGYAVFVEEVCKAVEENEQKEEAVLKEEAVETRKKNGKK